MKLNRIYKKVFEEKPSFSLGLLLLLLPLKLSLTYIVLIPLILIWILNLILNKKPNFDKPLKNLTSPLILFFIISLFSSLWGIRPITSIFSLSHTVFFFLSIFVFYSLLQNSQKLPPVLMLLIGQSFSALHTCYDEIANLNLKQLFIGTLTESGQLALTTCFSVSLLIYLLSKDRERIKTHLGYIAAGLFNLAVLLYLGFSEGLLNQKIFIIYFFATLVIAYLILKSSSDKNDKIYSILSLIILPLIFSALFFNLKRGPWLGVFISLEIFLIFIKPRLALIPPILAALCLFFIPPVTSRLAQSGEHFFIEGGRSAIWSIGFELSGRYPLGIGYDNASFLRKFSMEIPPQLEHFHNNFLNILVENGWIAFGVFLWWLYVLFSKSFFVKGENRVLIIGTAGSLLAWQIAGVVEYNFGDSEVLLIAYFMIAFLGFLLNHQESKLY